MRQNQLKIPNNSRVQQETVKCAFCEDKFDYKYYGFEMEGIESYIDIQDKKIEQWTHTRGNRKNKNK